MRLVQDGNRNLKMDAQINQLIKSITVIYRTLLYLLIGLSGLAAVLVFLYGSILIFGPEVDYYWLTSCILLSISLIPFGFYLFSIKAKTARETEDLGRKLLLFRQALRLKFILFSIAGVVNLTYYVLSGNQQGLLFILMVIIVLLISKPTQSQFENEFFQQLPD
jgi:hypothetical protein